MSDTEGKQMTVEYAREVLDSFELHPIKFNDYAVFFKAKGFLEGFSAGVRASAERMRLLHDYLNEERILKLLPKESGT